MIIVDEALRARAAEGRPVLFGLMGAGFMARGIINQQRHTSGWRCAAVCTRSVDKAAAVLRDYGAPGIAVVRSSDEADTVITSGGTAVTSDPDVLCACASLEALVEATGHVEYGARVAVAAIEQRKPIILMNAELDATVGPLLHRMAEAAGVIITGCDGDQPGVQMNLYRFVTSLGLEPLLCGNIKGLQDHYRTPETQASFAARWGQTPNMVTSFADGTKISFEQAVVANATGMTVMRRGMLGIEYDGHVDDLVDRFDPDELRSLGGVVEYTVGAKPSPGVFVLAAARDDVQRHYLDYGKLGAGPLYSFYVPYHLTVFEVPLSVARVVILGDAVIQPIRGAMVDVVATAKRALEPGHVVDGLGGYDTFGQCERYEVSREQGLLPMGLAEGCMVTRRIARDEVLRLEDVERPSGSLVHALRERQDDVFPALAAREPLQKTVS